MRSLFFRRSVARAKQPPTLREAARFLRNATLAPSYAEIRALVNNSSGLEATLTANTNTVVLTVGTTNDLYIGQLLNKTSGTGEFNTECFVVLISDADTTTFTVSNPHVASGAMVFSGANNFTTNHFARWIDAQMALSFPRITATQPARSGPDADYVSCTVNTLNSGTTNVTLNSGNTSKMRVGDYLYYTLGQDNSQLGRFGAGARVATITGNTTFTATVPHAASGKLEFWHGSGIQQTIRMRETYGILAVNRGNLGRTLNWGQFQDGRQLAEAYRFYFHPDKLRMRVTRALSELYSVGGFTILDGAEAARGTDFTDMLSASAFGNYEDHIYNVTKSLIMGRFLNHEGNRKASASSEPDENFAREIMQLYTIGVWELNLDGSRKLARNLSPNDSRYVAYPDPGWDAQVPTYGYDDIRSMARILTGYVSASRNQVYYLGNLDDTVTVTMASTTTSHGLVPGDGVYISFPNFVDVQWRTSFINSSTTCTVIDTLGYGVIHGLSAGLDIRDISANREYTITSVNTLTNTFTVSTASNVTGTRIIEQKTLNVISDKGYHPISAIFSVVSTSSDQVFTIDYSTLPINATGIATRIKGCGGYAYISSEIIGGIDSGMIIDQDRHEYALPKVALKWITNDPDKIENDAALDGSLYIPSRTISLNATLAANTNTVILRDVSFRAPGTTNFDVNRVNTTDVLYVGQPLYKISNTGVFGTGTFVTSINSSYEFTVSVNHTTSGNVTFTGTSTGFQATLEQGSNTVVLTPGKGIPQGLYVGQALSKISGTGVFGTGTVVSSIMMGSTTTFKVSVPHETSGVISFQGLNPRTMVGLTDPTLLQNLAEQEVRWTMRALTRHPSTAPYFVTRIIRMMVTSNPSPGYIARVASVFRNDGQGVVGNLAAVFKAILLDQEARAPASKNLIARGTDPHDLGATLVGATRRRPDRLGGRLESYSSSYGTGTSQYTYAVGDRDELNPGVGFGLFTQPSVFGRYPAIYSPAGPVQDAGKIAPELFLYDENGTTRAYNGNQGVGGGNIVVEIMNREQEHLQLAASAPESNIDALIEKYNILFTGGTASPAYIAALSSFIKNTTNFSRTTIDSQKKALQMIVHSLYISPYSVIRT